MAGVTTRSLGPRSRHQCLCCDIVKGSWTTPFGDTILGLRHGRDVAELTLGRDIDLRSRHGLAGWCVET